MKKALLVTIDFPPAVGGVASYWDQVCASLDRNFTVLAPPADKSPEFACAVIRRKLLFKYMWPRWLKGIYEIYKVYKSEKCEIIVVGQVLPVGSMVYMLHKLFGIPYIVQIYGQDLAIARQNKRKRALAGKVLDSAQKVMTNSEAVAGMVKSFTNKGIEAEVIYPVPGAPTRIGDIDALRQNYDLKGKKVVLTAGRLVPRKGQDKTLMAMKRVWEKYPDAIYAIVGGGPDMRRLKELASPFGDKVIFTGRVNREEVLTWMSVCDVFVMAAREMPDDVEGFGMVYLEAGHLAIPVIGGNAGGVPEAIVDGKTGLLVDPEDPHDIAEKILKLLNEPEYAKTLGQNARRRLQEDLTWEKSVNQLKAIMS